MTRIVEKIHDDNVLSEWSNHYYVRRKCLFFLYGYTFHKEGKYAIPIEVYTFVFSTCILGLIFILFKYSDDFSVIFDTIHYSLHMIVLISCCYQILKYRKTIETINTNLDRWFHYKELYDELKKVREEAEKESERMTFPYLFGMLSCNVPFCIAPLMKLCFSADRSKMVHFLIFPCYLGLPLETWWGFTITYIFEVICSTFSFTLYAHLAAYTVAVNIHVAYQMKVMGFALETVEERSKKITAKRGYSQSSPDWEKQYNATLYSEIQTNVIHLEYLQGMSVEIIKIFTPATTTTYTGGMWLVCFSGVLLTTIQETELLIKFCMTFIAELISMYMYSMASDYLLTSFTDTINNIYFSSWYNLPKPCCKMLLNMMTLLRKVPTLRTMMGYDVNIENLANILNASYTYFSLIVAMKK